VNRFPFSPSPAFGLISPPLLRPFSQYFNIVSFRVSVLADVPQPSFTAISHFSGGSSSPLSPKALHFTHVCRPFLAGVSSFETVADSTFFFVSRWCAH